MSVDSPKNGTNTLFMGMAVAIVVASITTAIGWTFVHVVEMSSTLAKIQEAQDSVKAHDVEQDKWIDEINRKFEAFQSEIRGSISQVDGHINDVRARMDGKVKGGP